MTTLIAYFSYTGHTKKIAQQIQNCIVGTLFEIRPSTPYSNDYGTTDIQGRKETQMGYQPPLEKMCDNLDFYDTVLLGTPNWFNTIAPPVATFLKNSNLSGKNIIPFCSNGGGGLGNIVSDIQNLCSDSKILNSLNIYEAGGENLQKIITNWLKNNI